MLQCVNCKRDFATKRGLAMHYNRQVYCQSRLKKAPAILNTYSNIQVDKVEPVQNPELFHDFYNNSYFEEADNSITKTSLCNELTVQYQQHSSDSGYMNVHENKKIHIMCIQLLHISKSANAPLYSYNYKMGQKLCFKS